LSRHAEQIEWLLTFKDPLETIMTTIQGSIVALATPFF